MRVATVNPVAHSLAAALLTHTSVEVTYLPPERLPVNRIPNWLNKHRHDKFAAFHAVVTLRSVLPEFDVYPSLRQFNIRVVPIDIAEALVPEGEKVAVASPYEYFWLNANNMLVMLGILRRDLSALFPGDQHIIDKNYYAVSSTVRQINMQLDELLTQADVFLVATTKPELSPLLSGLSSHVSSIEEVTKMGMPALVLTSQSSHSNESYWIVDDFSRFSETSLIERLKMQVTQLQVALAHYQSQHQ